MEGERCCGLLLVAGELSTDFAELAPLLGADNGVMLVSETKVDAGPTAADEDAPAAPPSGP